MKQTQEANNDDTEWKFKILVGQGFKRLMSMKFFLYVLLAAFFFFPTGGRDRIIP